MPPKRNSHDEFPRCRVSAQVAEGLVHMDIKDKQPVVWVKGTFASSPSRVTTTNSTSKDVGRHLHSADTPLWSAPPTSCGGHFIDTRTKPFRVFLPSTLPCPLTTTDITLAGGLNKSVDSPAFCFVTS